MCKKKSEQRKPTEVLLIGSTQPLLNLEGTQTISPQKRPFLPQWLQSTSTVTPTKLPGYHYRPTGTIAALHDNTRKKKAPTWLKSTTTHQGSAPQCWTSVTTIIQNTLDRNIDLGTSPQRSGPTQRLYAMLQFNQAFKIKARLDIGTEISLMTHSLFQAMQETRKCTGSKGCHTVWSDFRKDCLYRGGWFIEVGEVIPPLFLREKGDQIMKQVIHFFPISKSFCHLKKKMSLFFEKKKETIVILQNM